MKKEDIDKKEIELRFEKLKLEERLKIINNELNVLQRRKKERGIFITEKR